MTPLTGDDGALVGYIDPNATGTVSRVSVTLRLIQNDGNPGDIENMNAFLMDTSGQLLSAYYSPVSSSLG